MKKPNVEKGIILGAGVAGILGFLFVLISWLFPPEPVPTAHANRTAAEEPAPPPTAHANRTAAEMIIKRRGSVFLHSGAGVDSSKWYTEIEQLPTGFFYIQKINFTDTNVDNQDVEEILDVISEHSQLQGVYCSGTRFDEHGLDCFEKHHQLLWVYLCRQDLTDEGVKKLVGICPNIEVLHLDDTDISDTGIQHLKNFTKLRWLGLNGTNTSGGAREALAAHLVSCTIVKTR